MNNDERLKKALGVKDSVLKQYGITLRELIFLLGSYLSLNMEEAKTSLTLKGIGVFVENLPWLILSDKQRDLIDKILEERDAQYVSNSHRTQEQLNNLAKQMRELFPMGNMITTSGQKYPWRGSVAEISKRMKRWFEKYPNNYSDEDIIQATKNYVNNFRFSKNGMKTLMYFIMKNENNLGETIETSLLQRELENMDDLKRSNDGYAGNPIELEDGSWNGELR